MALLAAAGGLLLPWLLPSLFLGRDGRSVLRVLAAVAPAWPQFGRSG